MNSPGHLPATKPGAVLCFASGLFILTVPFSGVVKVGIFGNFDTNLALIPFFLALAVLVVSGRLCLALASGNAAAQYARWVAGFFVLCAMLTALNGMLLSAEGLSAYGLDPLSKSLVTMIAPLFIATLILVSFAIGATLPARGIQRLIECCFAVFIGYTILQLCSALVPNPAYDTLRGFFEGARGTTTQAYSVQFQRLNGPTMEPAELAKTVLLFFVPWLVFPTNGPPRTGRLVLAILVVIASASLIGILSLSVIFAHLLFANSTALRTRMSIFLAVFVLIAALPLYQDLIFGRMAERFGSGTIDESALIRYSYNTVALSLIVQNPFIGLGWSNEIFFFPDSIGHIAGLWEVQQDIANGNALTAKSLVLRLMMYSGLPGFLTLVIATLAVLRTPAPEHLYGIRRLRLVFLTLAVSGTLDGGILTSFYLWAGPALCLGVAAKPALHVTAKIPQHIHTVHPHISATR